MILLLLYISDHSSFRHHSRQRAATSHNSSHRGDCSSLHHHQLNNPSQPLQHDPDLQSYPALLRQEKTMPGKMSEYTHVWEVQAPSPAQSGMADSTVSTTNMCPHMHTFKRIPQCDLHVRDGCACVGGGGGIIYGTKESTYDTRRVVPYQPVNPSAGSHHEGVTVAPRNVPLYFDMDLTASIPPQARGNNIPIKSVQLASS